MPSSPNRDNSIPASTPDVSVIIVSYNTRELTLRCLSELTEKLQKEAVSHEVWVVDNASEDQSVEAIEREFPEVQIIASSRNLGFGPANNLAFARSRGRYLLLLNTDAFVHTNAVTQLMEFLEDPGHAGVGAVGPRLLNADGSLQISCYKFPSPLRAWLDALGATSVLNSHPQWARRWGNYNHWAHDQKRSVDLVIGACMLVRREVYEEVGDFDEQFFFYAEETDWQYRMRKAGWDVFFVPDAQVTHLGGASGATQKARVSKYFWEGQERYVIKHYGYSGLGLQRFGVVTGLLFRVMTYLIRALIPKQRARYLPLFRRGLSGLKRIIVSAPPSYKR